MLKMETVFGANSGITPDFAALLAQRASKFDSNVYLECGSTTLSVESLIGILAMDLRRGAKLTVSAEGKDAAAAVDCICTLLREGA